MQVVIGFPGAPGSPRTPISVARKREPATLDQLTPQEHQIAALVAEGLTNREVASRLFFSPRTVEHHLHKVFSKLGIASRAELIRHGPATEPT